MGTERNKKGILGFRSIFLMIVLVLGIVIGSTQVAFAYLQQRTKILNEFEIGEVKVSIVEDFNEEKTIKSNVAIKNEGTIPTYVRAAIAIYWKDIQGNLLLDIPIEGKDYVWIGAEDTAWMQGEDGFWYYKDYVNVGEQTDFLIKKCTDVSVGDDDRILVVDIVAQSIQAFPKTAAEDAWNITINQDGKIVFEAIDEVEG